MKINQIARLTLALTLLGSASTYAAVWVEGESQEIKMVATANETTSVSIIPYTLTGDSASSGTVAARVTATATGQVNGIGWAWATPNAENPAITDLVSDDGQYLSVKLVDLTHADLKTKDGYLQTGIKGPYLADSVDVIISGDQKPAPGNYKGTITTIQYSS